MESIKTHGYLNSKPITVNSRMEVSDGQHRLYACRELGMPIHYEIDNMPVNDSMVLLNTTSTLWRQTEFINHYAECGVFCYIELRNLINQTNYGVSNCIIIYGGNNIKPSQIRKGLPFNKSKNLTDIIELIEFFRGKVPFFLTGTFVKSLCAFLNNKDVKPSHVDKLKLNAFAIVQCATLDQYNIQLRKIARLK